MNPQPVGQGEITYWVIYDTSSNLLISWQVEDPGTVRSGLAKKELPEFNFYDHEWDPQTQTMIDRDHPSPAVRNNIDGNELYQ